METHVDKFSFLLNKIHKELGELELLQDISNDIHLLEKIKKIKNEISEASLTKDLNNLDKIWKDYFYNNSLNNGEDDFM